MRNNKGTDCSFLFYPFSTGFLFTKNGENMSRQIQIRRGTATENDAFTGAIGEVTMDTTNKTLRVHDGETCGGNEILSTNKYTSNLTNCITNIPQDINIELNDGTLTLKAGSKIYVPNGTNIYNTITIENDLTITDSSTRTLWLGVLLDGSAIIKCTSGETNAPSANTYKYYYDKTENKCYQSISGGYNQASFPIAVVKATSGSGITSIEQIFNGFGYIGSTFFALPGLKALAPYGRNTNGSSRNIECSISSVQILNAVSSWTWNGQLMIKPNGTLGVYGYGAAYNDIENYYKYQNTNVGLSSLAQISFSSGVITRFSPKRTLCTIDYNDNATITNLCIPNYTAGTEIQNTTASSGSYTAPSNGQFMLYIIAGTNSTTFKINNVTVGPQKQSTSGNYSINYNVFVNYGDSITWTCPASVTMKAYFYPMKRI